MSSSDISLLRAVRSTAQGLTRLTVLLGGSGLVISAAAVFNPPGARMIIAPFAATIVILCVQAWQNFRTVARGVNEVLARAVVEEVDAAAARTKSFLPSHRARRAPWSGRTGGDR